MTLSLCLVAIKHHTIGPSNTILDVSAQNILPLSLFCLLLCEDSR